MTSTTLDTPKRSRHRPTMPCATCPALLWWHKSYVLGVSRCQPCRRAARAERDAAKIPRPRGGTRGNSGNRNGRPRPPSRQCEVCAKPYRATYGGQRTCSRACGTVLRCGPPKPKPAPVQTVAELLTCRCGAAFLSERADLRWCDDCRTAGHHRYRPVDDSERTCPQCGGPFVAAFTGGRRRSYCSLKCANLARPDFRISPAERRAIYRRDAFLCHLCGYRVRPRQQTGEPWSASLDHLTPRSRGGTDDVDNLATCHLWCNVMRGADDIPAVWIYGAPPSSW